MAWKYRTYRVYRKNVNYILWKRKMEKKYRILGIGFEIDDFAINEASNMIRRGLDVKIRKNGKIWFDSTKM